MLYEIECTDTGETRTVEATNVDEACSLWLDLEEEQDGGPSEWPSTVRIGGVLYTVERVITHSCLVGRA